MFGSTRHSEHAMFKKVSRDHNNGRYLGFVKPSECRMAGEIIACLRLIRLKPTLQAVTTSAEFLTLKRHRDLAMVLSKETVWNFLFAIARAFYPIMRIVRLADCRTPGMDKLKYYILQADRILKEELPKIDIAYASLASTYKAVMTDDSIYEIGDIVLPQRKLKMADNDIDDEDEYAEGDADSDDNDSIDNEDGDEDNVDLPTSDDISLDDDEGVTFAGRILGLWKQRRPKLLHDYARVGYILSPHPVIMKHSRDNMSMEDKEATKRLITKLFIPVNVVGEDRISLQAKLIHQFWKEYGMSNFCVMLCLCQILTFYVCIDDFKNKTGIYEEAHIWVTAANVDVPAYQWHKFYSNPEQTVLGRLACRVTSKILGIGSAERSWKKLKCVLSGNRSNMRSEVAKKQAAIAGIHAQENNKQDKAEKAKAGLLWDDDDFKTLKMDALCLPLDVAPPEEVQRRTTRVFCAWIENWEKEKIKGNGDPVLEQRFKNKYCGLSWIDPDQPRRKKNVLTAHPDFVSLEKGDRGKKSYELLACLPGYDDNVANEDQMDKWEVWYRETTIECIKEYYNKNKHLGVVVYEKGSIDSDYGE